MITIYVLVCPINGDVRYVGKTSKSPAIRRSQHISEARRFLPGIGRRGDWIRYLLARGLKPILRPEVEMQADGDWQKAERDLIAHYRALGADLINGTNGGDGMSCPTDEWRLAQSLRGIGRKASEETRKKMSAAGKGRKQSPEHIEKRAAAHRGRPRGPHSEEHKRKIGAAGLGRRRGPMSEEQKVKVSEGLKRYFASIEKPIVVEQPKEKKKRVNGPCTPERAAKIRAALLGKKHTPERRDAMRSDAVRAKRAAAQGDLPV